MGGKRKQSTDENEEQPGLLGGCPLLLAVSTQTARADLGFWSSALVGKWRHPHNGDVYEFRSDTTYLFRAGAAKRRAGNLSHSVVWKIVQPTEKESGGSLEGPVALRLQSRNRTVLQGKTRRVLPSSRVFRIVADVVHSQSEKTDHNRYSLGGA